LYHCSTLTRSSTMPACAALMSCWLGLGLGVGVGGWGWGVGVGLGLGLG
jgi:hypothetical protein